MSLTFICEIAVVLWADVAAIPLVSLKEGEEAGIGRRETGGGTWLVKKWETIISVGHTITFPTANQ